MEAYLGENSLDGEPSVQSSGNHTQQAYLSPDKMKAFSRLSQFGMTYKPLTENLGEELLMSYLAGFRAKTSPQPEKAQELTESEAECGNKWHGSFAKWNQDSCLWKTHQCSLLGGLDEFLETWPQWGLMRSGECWEQQMSAHRINETESGLLEKWPTPATKGYGHASEGMVGNLITKIQNGVISKEEAEAMLNLPQLENHRTWKKKWGTPKAQDSRHAKTDRGKCNLGEQVSGLHNGGSLNPMWVEWLMGWPLGWTDLKPLETDKFHFVQQQHGES